MTRRRFGQSVEASYGGQDWRGVATRSRPAASLLHDLLLQTLHEPHDFGLLPRRDPEVVERSVDVTQEALPVTLVDPEAAVGHLHVASDVVEWTTGGGAEEVDQKLFLAAYAVFTHDASRSDRAAGR